MQIVNVLPGDADVTNSVAPHPHFPVLATSGIEDHVKLWEPVPVGPLPLLSAERVSEIVQHHQRAMKQRQPSQEELMEVRVMNMTQACSSLLDTGLKLMCCMRWWC